MQNITTTVTNDSMAVMASNLIAQREAWEKGAYATSLTQLYTLLGGSLDLFNAIKINATLAKGLNELLRSLSVDFNSNTSLELRIARLVFATPGAETKTKNRVNAYARVIRVAADNKQTSATIAQFINDNHGVEEIRRHGVGTGKSTVAADKERNRNVANSVYAEPTATALFSNFALPADLTPQAGHRFSVALVRQNLDGTGSIVFGTNNIAVVNTVLATGGKLLREHAHQQAEANLIKQQEAQLTQNMQDFANLLGSVPSLQQKAA